MIQIVSAYLIKQRGIVTDDDPSHIRPKYEEKNKFKRWLLEDPLRYSQHLYIDVGGSAIHMLNSVHSATMWHDEYEENDTYTIRPIPENSHTTLDGNTSICDVGDLTWGLLIKDSFSQAYIGSYSAVTDGPINQVLYYTYLSPKWISFIEERNCAVSDSSITPPEHLEGTVSYQCLAAESHSNPWVHEDWTAYFYSARIASGVPVFTSYEDGTDYCAKVLEYLSNQSSANYQTVCEAIDKCINP